MTRLGGYASITPFWISQLLWQGGEPVAGDDVSEAVFAPLDGLAPFELWSEAHRVIAIARDILKL